MTLNLPGELPTPYDLMRDPELASLTLLEVALHVASHAIIAENMELCAQEDIVESQHRPSTQTAGGILDKLDALWRDCERYRRQRKEEALAPTKASEDF